MSETPEPPITVVVNDSGFRFRAAVTELPSIDLHVPGANGRIDPAVVPEVVITNTSGSDNLVDLIQRGARWVHTVGTGVDEFPFEVLDGQTFTCSRGASSEPIGEWVLAQMLAFAKALPDAWVTEEPELWGFDRRIGSLRDATVVIVGVGGIGTEVARLSLAFGMRVIGVRRTDAPAPLPQMEISTDLAAVVGEADHLVLAAPATSATNHAIGAELLRRAKPGLHLVNIARGALVDQDALRAALDDGRVARASLDVSDPEPLLDGHWLYSHERVRLSPHVSWAGPTAYELLTDRFVDNYNRWRAGEPLHGEVDTQLGY